MIPSLLYLWVYEGRLSYCRMAFNNDAKYSKEIVSRIGKTYGMERGL